jgi:type IV secretory pathway VirB2 component (pilin)
MANSKSHKLAKSVIGKLNFTAVFLMCAAQAHAGGTGLPWDGPIVAFLFALGGMVVLGVRWVFGGEMGSMTRSLLTAVAGIALLVFAADFLSGLFGVSSALILK